MKRELERVMLRALGLFASLVVLLVIFKFAKLMLPLSRHTVVLGAARTRHVGQIGFYCADVLCSAAVVAITIGLWWGAVQLGQERIFKQVVFVLYTGVASMVFLDYRVFVAMQGSINWDAILTYLANVSRFGHETKLVVSTIPSLSLAVLVLVMGAMRFSIYGGGRIPVKLAPAGLSLRANRSAELRGTAIVAVLSLLAATVALLPLVRCRTLFAGVYRSKLQDLLIPVEFGGAWADGMPLAKHRLASHFKDRYGFNLPGDTNIVVVLLEGVSHKHLSLSEQQQAHTPFLQSLREKGVFVDRFFVPIPHSAQSHFCLLTGTYLSPTGSRYITKYSCPSPSLPSTLRLGGFRTYLFSSADVDFESERSLFDRAGLQIFEKEDWQEIAEGECLENAWGVDDAVVLQEASKLIDPSGGPFFALYLLSNTHSPYWNPKPESFSHFTDSEELGRYLNSIEYTDSLIARLFDDFERRGWAENTLFIITADHGESFGEHGYRYHSYSIYNEEVRVPFLMYHPRLEGLSVGERFGTILDVYPTIVDLLGMESSHAVHGISLFAPAIDRQFVLSSWSTIVNSGLIRDERKYVFNWYTGTLLSVDLDDGDVQDVSGDDGVKRAIVGHALSLARQVY